MKLQFMPLLHKQRALYQMPRGRARFAAYAQMMHNDNCVDSQVAPLVAMNPMAKDHAAVLVDRLQEMHAEDIAREAATLTANDLSDVDGTYKIGLVVADDVGGGWTNRYASEFAWASGSAAALRPGWLAGVLWSSEEPTVRGVQEAVLVPIFRAAYIEKHGTARSLQDLIDQEGFAMASANCSTPSMTAEDLDYTTQMLTPLMGETNPRTLIECLYGDTAARSLGFTRRGLSHLAGLALALHRARCGIAPSFRAGSVSSAAQERDQADHDQKGR